MAEGLCQLCGVYGQLVENGHVWPGFVYKRFVTEKGGRFADLMKGKYHGNQYKKPWFCKICDNERLSRLENDAAQLFTQFCNGMTAYKYSDKFLSFATSISWRVALFDLEQHKTVLNECGKAALIKWKECLLDPAKDIHPNTQHAFVAFDQEADGLHQGLGGEIYRDEGFVFSHIGPLHIVGWLEKPQFSVEEEATWERIRISKEGGLLLQATHESIDSLMTAKFFQTMLQRQQRIEDEIKKFGVKCGLLP
jgi:hypothetical protein